MYQALFHKIQESRAHLIIVNLRHLISNIKNPSENEQKILIEDRNFRYYRNIERKYELAKYYREYDNEDDIRLVYDFRLSNLRAIMQNGVMVMADTTSKYYNIVNNLRITTDIQYKYNKTIYLFGNCIALGILAEDKYTIASQLQKKFNAIKHNEIRVINAGGVENASRFNEIIRRILSPKYEFRANDVIVIFSNNSDMQPNVYRPYLKKFHDTSFLTYCDFSKIFQRPHKFGEILFDNFHMNHNGYYIVTTHLFNAITKIMENQNNVLPDIPQDLIPYMQYISALKKERDGKKGIAGSIVMNCNPFTLGHKYLITEALKRCDYLYIFILEEDRSFFSFDDRIAMVKTGIQEFQDISVIPSGKAIISSVTFPEYFDKEYNKNVTIDTSRDLTLFSTLIAPALDITKRFAGNEPFCHITRQYNDGMRSVLPKYGIEFIELQRFSVNKKEISASLVREYIKDNKHDDVKKLVPTTTYEYLLQKKYLHK